MLHTPDELTACNQTIPRAKANLLITRGNTGNRGLIIIHYSSVPFVHRSLLDSGRIRCRLKTRLSFHGGLIIIDLYEETLAVNLILKGFKSNLQYRS